MAQKNRFQYYYDDPSDTPSGFESELYDDDDRDETTGTVTTDASETSPDDSYDVPGATTTARVSATPVAPVTPEAAQEAGPDDSYDISSEYDIMPKATAATPGATTATAPAGSTDAPIKESDYTRNLEMVERYFKPTLTPEEKAKRETGAARVQSYRHLGDVFRNIANLAGTMAHAPNMTFKDAVDYTPIHTWYEKQEKEEEKNKTLKYTAAQKDRAEYLDALKQRAAAKTAADKLAWEKELAALKLKFQADQKAADRAAKAEEGDKNRKAAKERNDATNRTRLRSSRISASSKKSGKSPTKWTYNKLDMFGHATGSYESDVPLSPQEQYDRGYMTKEELDSYPPSQRNSRYPNK